MTRDEARKRLTAESRAFEQLADLLRAPPEEAESRLEALIDDKRKLERELAEARRRLAMGGGGSAASEPVGDRGGEILSRAP